MIFDFYLKSFDVEIYFVTFLTKTLYLVTNISSQSMRNVVLFLLIINFWIARAQPYSGTVTLISGAQRTGFINHNADNGILFGSAANDLTAIPAADVASYDIDVNGVLDRYFFVLAKPSFGAKNPAKLRAMKLISEGSKLNVYEYRVSSLMVIAMSGRESFELYVREPGADEAVFFSGRSAGAIDAGGAIVVGGRKYDRYKFKDFATEFFKDCPALVQKIKSKELKAKDSLEILEYYNTQCK